ncbi:A/G-specific adenine glycosylase [Schleiferilactobacillus harbinensis]|jgi:A/G-specific adenine glycosylase|uniref:A/G-specific adenine glycosylase n=1 Tax=Schleiferilactobacillus harbinensis TaxID=304207 RepID=UPI0024325F79|nr:A/G-specific adenine glycosylase [Schleiferilactobacillus harbinensis]MCI1849478.1 A/G-specific adenine glycosylase [Schleiferilactobacillus harbinensis]
MIHWDDATIDRFQRALLTWYDAHGRDLPWRRDHDPYHVWLSEVMLQQTGVSTVIPYYEKWLAHWPTIAELAAADEDAVLKEWAGLGYYSRARNLLKTARVITNERGGQWPQDAAGLKQLPGIGDYVAGAVASIAFSQPVPAIDGNAYRVFSRLLLIDTDIRSSAAKKVFNDAITPLIPADRPGDFNQAVMDLGSSYMRAKDPDSAHSPVAAFDAAYQQGVTDQYPVKAPKKKPVAKAYTALALLAPDGQVVWQQRPPRGLLADLWTWPLLTGDQQGASAPVLIQQLADEHGIILDPALVLRVQPVGESGVVHVFTHQRWTITVVQLTLADVPPLPVNARWLPLTQQELALPTMQRKVSAYYNRNKAE